MSEEASKRIASMYNQLIQSKAQTFRDRIPSETGVYAIYEDDNILYVGSAKDLERRLKHDLLGTMGQSAQPHTFGRKLIEKFGNKDEARNYLRQKCGLRICLTESLQEARVLEQFAILLLKPKFNA